MGNSLKYSILVLLVLLSVGCAQSRITHQQGALQGYVTAYMHDNLPIKEGHKGVGFSTTLYIYAPTLVSQVDNAQLASQKAVNIQSKLIDSVTSNNKGFFTKWLAPGKYSIFIKWEDAYYIPYFSGSQWLSLFEIKPGEQTSLDLKLIGEKSYQ